MQIAGPQKMNLREILGKLSVFVAIELTSYMTRWSFKRRAVTRPLSAFVRLYSDCTGDNSLE